MLVELRGFLLLSQTHFSSFIRVSIKGWAKASSLSQTACLSWVVTDHTCSLWACVYSCSFLFFFCFQCASCWLKIIIGSYCQDKQVLIPKQPGSLSANIHLDSNFSPLEVSVYFSSIQFILTMFAVMPEPRSNSSFLSAVNSFFPLDLQGKNPLSDLPLLICPCSS